MRKLGATVDCVSNAVAAIAKINSAMYRLVLIDLGGDVEGAEQLERDIRLKHPKQLVRFLVAGPALIAKTPTPEPAEATRAASGLEVSASSNPGIGGESEFGRKVRELERQNGKEQTELS
jgi:hypothetical protein